MEKRKTSRTSSPECKWRMTDQGVDCSEQPSMIRTTSPTSFQRPSTMMPLDVENASIERTSHLPEQTGNPSIDRASSGMGNPSINSMHPLTMDLTDFRRSQNLSLLVTDHPSLAIPRVSDVPDEMGRESDISQFGDVTIRTGSYFNASNRPVTTVNLQGVNANINGNSSSSVGHSSIKSGNASIARSRSSGNQSVTSTAYPSWNNGNPDATTSTGNVSIASSGNQSGSRNSTTGAGNRSVAISHLKTNIITTNHSTASGANLSIQSGNPSIASSDHNLSVTSSNSTVSSNLISISSSNSTLSGNLSHFTADHSMVSSNKSMASSKMSGIVTSSSGIPQIPQINIYPVSVGELETMIEKDGFNLSSTIPSSAKLSLSSNISLDSHNPARASDLSNNPARESPGNSVEIENGAIRKTSLASDMSLDYHVWNLNNPARESQESRDSNVDTGGRVQFNIMNGLDTPDETGEADDNFRVDDNTRPTAFDTERPPVDEYDLPKKEACRLGSKLAYRRRFPYLQMLEKDKGRRKALDYSFNPYWYVTYDSKSTIDIEKERENGWREDENSAYINRPPKVTDHCNPNINDAIPFLKAISENSEIRISKNALPAELSKVSIEDLNDRNDEDLSHRIENPSQAVPYLADVQSDARPGSIQQSSNQGLSDREIQQKEYDLCKWVEKMGNQILKESSLKDDSHFIMCFSDLKDGVLLNDIVLRFLYFSNSIYPAARDLLENQYAEKIRRPEKNTHHRRDEQHENENGKVGNEHGKDDIKHYCGKEKVNQDSENVNTIHAKNEDDDDNYGYCSEDSEIEYMIQNSDLSNPTNFRPTSRLPSMQPSCFLVPPSLRPTTAGAKTLGAGINPTMARTTRNWGARCTTKASMRCSTMNMKIKNSMLAQSIIQQIPKGGNSIYGGISIIPAKKSMIPGVGNHLGGGNHLRFDSKVTRIEHSGVGGTLRKTIRATKQAMSHYYPIIVHDFKSMHREAKAEDAMLYGNIRRLGRFDRLHNIRIFNKILRECCGFSPFDLCQISDFSNCGSFVETRKKFFSHRHHYQRVLSSNKEEDSILAMKRIRKQRIIQCLGKLREIIEKGANPCIIPANSCLSIQSYNRGLALKLALVGNPNGIRNLQQKQQRKPKSAHVIQSGVLASEHLFTGHVTGPVKMNYSSTIPIPFQSGVRILSSNNSNAYYNAYISIERGVLRIFENEDQYKEFWTIIHQIEKDIGLDKRNEILNTFIENDGTIEDENDIDFFNPDWKQYRGKWRKKTTAELDGTNLYPGWPTLIEKKEPLTNKIPDCIAEIFLDSTVQVKEESSVLSVRLYFKDTDLLEIETENKQKEQEKKQLEEIQEKQEFDEESATRVRRLYEEQRTKEGFLKRLFLRNGAEDEKKEKTSLNRIFEMKENPMIKDYVRIHANSRNDRVQYNSTNDRIQYNSDSDEDEKVLINSQISPLSMKSYLEIRMEIVEKSSSRENACSTGNSSSTGDVIQLIYSHQRYFQEIFSVIGLEPKVKPVDVLKPVDESIKSSHNPHDDYVDKPHVDYVDNPHADYVGTLLEPVPQVFLTRVHDTFHRKMILDFRKESEITEKNDEAKYQFLFSCKLDCTEEDPSNIGFFLDDPIDGRIAGA